LIPVVVVLSLFAVGAAALAGLFILVLDLFAGPGFQGSKVNANDIFAHLKNGGLLEHAQQMAAHESARTTKLYDRRSDKITLDEVEKIML
jgi:hypothetical protein